MKAKKNNLTFILVMALALTLLTAATVAASSTNTGYEAFKEALGNIDHEGGEGGSGKVSVKVTDNGEEIFSLDAEGIGDRLEENFSAGATISDGSTEKDIEIYGIDGDVYLIDLDAEAYYSFEDDEEMDSYREERKDRDHEMTAVEEELMDYFVGDLKENFSVTEKDSGDTRLEFSMEDSEVPTGLNLMIKAAAAADHRSDGRQEEVMDDFSFLDDFDFEDRPELVEDVALQAVAITIDVNKDNLVENMDLYIEMTGYDADGDYHELAVSVEVERKLDNQAPATIDVDAYEWEVVEQEDSRNSGR